MIKYNLISVAMYRIKIKKLLLGIRYYNFLTNKCTTFITSVTKQVNLIVTNMVSACYISYHINL
jgi:hypothetical protein